MRRLKVVAPERLSAERFFRELFLPLYPKGMSVDEARKTDANPANNPAILSAVEETANVFAALAPQALDRGDLDLDGSDASVHRLSKALTAQARDALYAQRQTPGEPPLLVHFVIHAALYIGWCAVKNHGGRWLVRSPLWETRVELESKAGKSEICPFSWLVRCLSDEDMGKRTLADRYRTLVENPFEKADEWPVIAPSDRRLPRLSTVRYDTLYQHLKRHLPELDDLGEDFPSAERFTELGFQWMDFLLVGGGRALVMHGPTKATGRGKGGVHIFWLTKAGFTKAVFFESELGGESHRVVPSKTAEGVETVVISRLVGDKTLEDEMLWWGP